MRANPTPMKKITKTLFRARSPRNKTIKLKILKKVISRDVGFIGVNNVSMVSKVDGVKHARTHTRMNNVDVINRLNISCV